MKSVSSQPASPCSLAGRISRLATSTNARSVNDTPLARPSQRSRMFQRPSCSKRVRMASTGPQVEASTIFSSALVSASGWLSPRSRRWSLGRIASSRSLRPRSTTVRCLGAPPSRYASTTRTYSLTVPLLERTLTILGYMEIEYHDSFPGRQGENQLFSENTRHKNVTTPSGRRRPADLKKQGSESRGPFSYPKHGLALQPGIECPQLLPQVLAPRFLEYRNRQEPSRLKPAPKLLRNPCRFFSVANRLLPALQHQVPTQQFTHGIPFLKSLGRQGR